MVFLELCRSKHFHTLKTRTGCCGCISPIPTCINSPNVWYLSNQRNYRTMILGALGKVKMNYKSSQHKKSSENKESSRDACGNWPAAAVAEQDRPEHFQSQNWRQRKGDERTPLSVPPPPPGYHSQKLLWGPERGMNKRSAFSAFIVALCISNYRAWGHLGEKQGYWVTGQDVAQGWDSAPW